VSEAVQLAWARAICVGSPLFVRRLVSVPRDARLEDGKDTHEFRFQGGELSYCCRSTRPHGGLFAVEYPVEQLVLCAPRPSRGQSAVLRAFPPAVAGDAAADIGPFVHPACIRVRRPGREGRVRVTVPRPVVGLHYGLDVVTGSSAGAPRPPPAPVVAAREAAGMSARALARRAGLSHRAVDNLEAGSDPRAATLRAVLRALPELAPQEALAEAREPLVMSMHERWEYLARLYGLAADELIKVVEIEGDGGRLMRIHTRGLRSLRRGSSEVQVRVGLRRMVLHDRPDLLLDVEAGDEDVTVKRLDLMDGCDRHEIRFRGRGEGTRFQYIRTYRAQERYVLTAREVRAITAKPGPFRAGSSIPIAVPVQRCRLVVIFPPAYVPRDLRGHAWPACLVADEPIMTDPAYGQVPVRAFRRCGRQAVELSVRRPVIGLAYSLSWELP
jgi:transcriptional regulator with XRE-family HTH domain